MTKITILVVSFFLLTLSPFLSADPITDLEHLNLEPSVRKKSQFKRLPSRYVFSDKINPFYLRGDFNGDQQPDHAVLIEELSTKRYGMAIFHQGKKKPFILGAGQEFGHGGLDFVWLDVWRVSRRTTLPSENKKEEPRKLVGEGLHVEKKGTAQALIYWDGEDYQWQQLEN